jgi:hypothetical protein
MVLVLDAIPYPHIEAAILVNNREAENMILDVKLNILFKINENYYGMMSKSS